MSTDKTDLSDDIYLNEFHKKWCEDCAESIRQMQSMPFTAEQARAQSKRLESLWRAEEEEKKAKRKSKK